MITVYDYDVICIGAGSGGCASAMRCADLGKKVALVEYREKGTGGTCVNRGCIPTKVLTKAAQVFAEINQAQKYGIVTSGVEVDLKAVQRKKTSIINNLRFALDNFLIKPRKIDRIQGKARFVDEHTLQIEKGDESRRVTAENIIIATGSEPAMIPVFSIDRKKIITSDEALNLEVIPEEIIVVGAGAIGLEFAYIFSTFGAKVTVVEMMPQVVPTMNDTEITTAIQKYLEKNGIKVLVGTKITGINVLNNGKVSCSFADGQSVETDMVLVAIGRKLNTGDLGLNEIGVQLTSKGRIIVDEQMRTSVRNIFAVGDIVEGPQLSHKAQRQGLVAAEVIAGLDSRMRYDAIPWAIFMQPEIAGVGMTTADAASQGIEPIVGKMYFNANEKAITMQQTTGLIKLVARKDNHRIIGGQVFGVDASVLIGEISLAVDRGLTLEMVAESVHAHPTLSEIIMEVAKQALGRAFYK